MLKKTMLRITWVDQNGEPQGASACTLTALCTALDRAGYQGPPLPARDGSGIVRGEVEAAGWRRAA